MKELSAAILAAFAWLMAMAPNLAASQPFSGVHEMSMAAQTMYTVDYIEGLIPFSFASDFMMKVAALHGLNESAPFWEIGVSLENRSGAAMSGFVAMEHVLFDPKAHSIAGLPDADFFDFCSRRHEIEGLSAESGAAADHPAVQFVDWKFDGVPGPQHGFRHSRYLHLNVTEPVHESGLWVHIVYLCVAEGPHLKHHGLRHHHRWTPWRRFHRPTVHLHGHQHAVNPLGLLGGHQLMALPVLFAAVAVYSVLFVVWTALMVKHRANLIPSVHWTVWIGIGLVIADALWEYTKMWRLNLDGFNSPSLRLKVANQCIVHALSLYVRTAAMILSTGTGIARPDLGKKMVRFLIIYGAVFSAVHGRIQWIEFELELAMSPWTRGPSGFELQCIRKLLFALNLSFVAVIAFNATAVLIRLDRDQQRHKKALFHRLLLIAAFAVAATFGLSVLRVWAAVNVDVLDSGNWALLYFVDHGFWRMMHLMVAIAVIAVFRPHQHSLRMAYSAEIPTTGTEDITTSGTARATTEEAEDSVISKKQENSSWDEMVGAAQRIGTWISTIFQCDNANDAELQ